MKNINYKKKFNKNYFNLLLYIYTNEINSKKDIEIAYNELNKLLDLKHYEKKILNELKILSHYTKKKEEKDDDEEEEIEVEEVEEEEKDLTTIISWLKTPLTTEFPYKNTSIKNNNYLPVFSELFKVCDNINNNNISVILNLLD